MSHRFLLAVILPMALGWNASAEGNKRRPKPTEASKAFKRGQQLFEDEDYLGAIQAFERAYSLRPHHVVLCNIALCHERKGDLISAAGFYRRCLAEGAEGTDAAQSVHNTLKKVEARIGWITVSSSRKKDDIYIDGRRVGQTPSRLALNPGTHVVEVRRPNAQPARTMVTSQGGTHRSIRLEPRVISKAPPPGPKRPPPSPRRLSPAWFWAASGLTVALGTVATVLGVQTLGLRDDYEETPTRDLLDRGRNRRLLTNIFWGAAGAAAGGTAVLFLYTDLGGRTAEPSRQAAVVLGLKGTF